MGWADCGTDSRGRPIGYAFEAVCDWPGCDTLIHRGLAYTCGRMHGEDVDNCDGYFCPDHLTSTMRGEDPMVDGQRCLACAYAIENIDGDDDWPAQEDLIAMVRAASNSDTPRPAVLP